MEYRNRSIWKRSARTVLLKVLSTLFMVLLSPLWVEAGRQGLLAVLGFRDLSFFGLWDIRPLSVAEGAAVLSLGVFATLGSVAYTVYLWYHGFLSSLNVESRGLRKIFDGNPSVQKLYAWESIQDVHLQILSGGVAVYLVLERAGTGKTREEHLVLLPTSRDAEQMSRDILSAREAWRTGRSETRMEP